MRRLGLRGVRRGGWKKPRTTVPDPWPDRQADLVNRGFAPDAPNRLWVVDFTFVSTRAGTAYTAFVIDAFSRLITGWRTAAHHSTDLVLDALVMAVTYRAPAGRQGGRADPPLQRRQRVPVHPLRRRAGRLGHGAISAERSGTPTTTRWPRASSACTKPRSPATWGHGKPPPRSRPPSPANGPAPTKTPRRVMRRTGGRPPGRVRAGLAGRQARPGPRPRAGRRAPPAARAGGQGGGDGRRSLPRRAPPAPARGSAPDPRPCLRDAPAGHHGCGAGRVSPRRPRQPVARNPRPGQGRLRRRRR